MNHRRLVYRFLITTIFGLFGIVLYAQHSNSSLIVPGKREVWVQSAILKLKNFQTELSTSQVEFQEISFEDYFRLKVRVNGSGKLVLPRKNRIFFLTSSSHDQPEVGDISLAMDRHGRIYQNDGHVCGGIITFETGEINKLKRSKQFFRYFVSDTDGEGWQRIR